jgi:transcriptional regulator with XRE-family HTH domain
MIVPMARREAEGGEDTAVGNRIAQNMQVLLRANGWTQGQLAYKARMPQSGISALMVGRRNPSLQSVYKISQAFGVPMEELAGFKPLQMPEIPAPAADSDRLAALEKKIAVLSDLPGQVQHMADAMASLLEQRSSPRKPKPRGEEERRSA